MRYTLNMRKFTPLGVLLGILTIVGCAAAPPPQYQDLIDLAVNGEPVDVATFKRSFLATDDLADRMQRIAPLERQAVAMLDDEPLKLGAIGTAILDQYYGSLSGHLALAAFYDHVGDDSANVHRDWADRISSYITSTNDGSRDSPFRVITAAEAQAYLMRSDRAPVGSMYHSTAKHEFLMMVAAKPEAGSIQNVYFDLQDAYDAVKFQAAVNVPDEEFTPGSLIGYLAQRDDSAAQAFIGTFLAAEERLDEAINWLSASTRTGNMLANLMLARVWWTKARLAENEEIRGNALEFVLENYLQAIRAGSDEAMYLLGVLYMTDQYGDDKIDQGIALMEQSGDLDNTEALRYLGQLYVQGSEVERDLDLSERYFVRAAELDDSYAKLEYAQFLISPDVDRPFNDRAYRWLREVAREKPDTATQDPGPSADAMLLIGNLYAKGVHVRRSFRRARSWFRDAVAEAPDDANIVNEVAWTLAVTHLEKLRSPTYALKIMERVMSNDELARQNPAYLDTWAAAHAATGNFDRAIDLQQQALEQATAQSETEVIPVLQEHLDAFRAGETITDAIP